MELRERVAKDAHEVLSRANVLAYLDMPDDTAFKIADAAIAAVLDAMQEPSEGMVLAAEAVEVLGADLHDFEAHNCAPPIWQAMLAAFRTEALGK